MPLQAIIVLTGENPDREPLSERKPVPMLPLLDRPFVQHVVESLVSRGISELDVLLCHVPEMIEEHFGDGTRWGCTVRYHLVKDPRRPYGRLRALRFSPERGHVLLAHGDRLPLVSDVCAFRPASADAGSVLFCAEAEGEADGGRRGQGGTWTGWAWISPVILETCPPGADEAELEAFLRSGAPAQSQSVGAGAPLRAQSFEDLLHANRAVLEKGGAGLFLSGRETDPGIWLSRNVSLHPMARLVAPVYIGENCRIGLGVQLGPGAVVGRDCVLEKRCTVADSLILPGSYVGEALELADVIVDRNRLVNVRVGAAVTVTDNFILGNLRERRFRKGVLALCSRLAAAVMLAVSFPVLLLTALVMMIRGRKPALCREEAVCLPAPEDAALWKTFPRFRFNERVETERGPRPAPECEEGREGPEDLFLRLLPALLNIVRGEMRFVGVRPRTRAEMASLPPDWRTLVLTSKPGVVTEAFIAYGADPTPDERYTAEAFYCVSTGFAHDLQLLLRYLRRILPGRRLLLSGSCRRSAGRAAP